MKLSCSFYMLVSPFICLFFAVVKKNGGSGRMSPVRARTMKEYEQVCDKFFNFRSEPSVHLARFKKVFILGPRWSPMTAAKVNIPYLD
jgi:hypothetical protein